MMKFLAVLLVAAVFAVSAVDGQRNATCLPTTGDPYKALLAGVLDTYNRRIADLMKTANQVIETAICAKNAVIHVHNADCINDLYAQMRRLPQTFLSASSQCTLLEVVFPSAQEDMKLFCFLQKCIATGYDACLVILQAVATKVVNPPAGVKVNEVLLMLNSLIWDMKSCLEQKTRDIPAALAVDLARLIAKIAECPPLIGG